MDKVKERKEELMKQAEELSTSVTQGEQQLQQMKNNLISLQGAIMMCNELEEDKDSKDKSASSKKAN